MSLPKKKLLLNFFFNAQFNYGPLVWMLHSRSSNNRIKHLHERCLRIVYQKKQSSYENLLVKNATVSMHHRNIQALARRVTRHYSGQGRFLKIRAFRQIFNQQHTKERPRREKFRRFFSYIRLKQHFKREMKPIDEPS